MRVPNLNHIPGPRGLAFIRLMLHFQRDSLGALEETFRRYGSVVSYPWPISTVIIYEPKIIKQVLIDKNQIYVKGTQTEKMKEVLGEGLVTNNDRESWLKNRVIVSREMNSRAILGFSEVILNETKNHLESWSSDEVDVTEAMRKLTFEIAGKTLLGTHLTRQDSNEVDAAVLYTSRLAHDHMFQLLPIPYWVPVKKNRIFHQHNRNLTRIVNRLIAEAKVAKEKKLAPQSIVEKLVHTELDDKALKDEILTLLIAGYETTANSLCWILGLLALHPEIQKKIFEEVRDAGPITGMEFAKSHPWLHASLTEGIRLYTAIPMSSRKSMAPDQFGNYSIPANTSVVIPVWVIHRDKTFWEDPLTFNPERFMGVDIATLDSYIPFSKGSRRCVGEAFAMVEMAIIVQEILKNFELSSGRSALPDPVAHVSLKPKEAVVLKTRNRC